MEGVLRQLSPFPFDMVKEQLDRYPENVDLIWTQEEAKNNGAWAYIEPRFETATGKPNAIRYVGRQCSASPATGSKTAHLRELNLLLSDSFAL